MKIDLFDVEEFIDVNHLKEVTSHVLMQRGDIPDPNGLISTEIFGSTTKARKETFAYIDLHAYFFHPHIYIAIKRMYRNIDKIINGEMYVIITKEGYLKEDPINGQTGLDFLYDNWNKIKWEEKSGSAMRTERIELITEFKKKEVFMHYQLVIPAFYRDVKSAQSGGGETEDINKLYSSLIRMCRMLDQSGFFDWQLDMTKFNIQQKLVEIYEYFKSKLEKKNGVIRKFLMGKNVDYCTRTVITAPTYHADRAEDLIVDFEHAMLPLGQVCSLIYPFIIHYLKNFFEQNVIDKQFNKILYDPAKDEITDVIEIKDPEVYFNDRYIKKMVDLFIRDPESRFNKIEVPTNTNKKLYLAFSGMRLDSSTKAELGIVNRPMTWTDLLYMAAEEVCRDKHCVITRYPVLNEFGVFVSKFRVGSTIKTTPMTVNGYLYKWYPVINFDVPKDRIGSLFNDATNFSNAYLDGLDGDYDGDQVTVKIIYTQEANEECEQVIYRKSNFIDSSGSNIRKISKEAYQTFYVLTKDPHGESTFLSKENKEFFTKLDPNDITFNFLIDIFGNTTSIDNGKNTNRKQRKFSPTDEITLTHSDYFLVKQGEQVKTTLGRLIFNKVMIEGLGFEKYFTYQNETMIAKRYGGFEAVISSALREDQITTTQMIKYINTRDWLGLQLHGIITTSFTPGVLKTPENVKKLKKELLEKYKDEIAKGDIRVVEYIEQELLKAMIKELDGDIGLDLYLSGARGSINNHLKNMFLMRGAVQNTVTNQFDIIENSLMDGLSKKDVPTHSNMIVAGAYPKAVGTQVSGYMSKELLSLGQTEVLGPKDSDCGSIRTIDRIMTNSTKKRFLYRYIKENGKLICLTPEIIDKYVGKLVHMRSPLCCIGTGEQKNLCNKCAGDFYYKLDKRNIGLVTCTLSGTISNLNLQKFHDNTVHTKLIDVDHMLI